MFCRHFLRTVRRAGHMTTYSGALSLPAPALRRIASVVLVLGLLASGATGRAGVQVLDSAISARIFALHLHGIPGEREYVHRNAGPAPWVHAHCHDLAPQPAPQPGVFELQAAASLAGAALCGAAELAVSPAPAGRPLAEDVDAAPESRSFPPPPQPPR